MRISATGRRNNNPHRRGHSGFTLIEVLVVLVIISIVISFAVLSVDTGPEELHHEGARLASLLDLASEDAVMNGREYRVLFVQDGYSFEEMAEGKWQPASDDILQPHQLPAGLYLQFSLEDQAIPLPRATDDKKKDSAVLLLLSSGELPSFKVIVAADQEDEQYLIQEKDGTIETEKVPNGSGA